MTQSTDLRVGSVERLAVTATAIFTTIFVITILAMVAMLIGDPNAPINLWFNVHGATIMTIEVVGIGVLGMSAMIVDRRETLRELRQKGRGDQVDRRDAGFPDPPNS